MDSTTTEGQSDQEQKSNYWGDLQGDDLGKAVIARFGSFRDWLRQNGMFATWRLKLHYYYNEYRPNYLYPHLGIMQDWGAQGEYHYLSLNNLRSVMKTILTSVVQNPPSYSTRATNTDADSMEAAALFQGVLDYYKRTKRLNEKLERALELAIVVDSAYALTEWDFFAAHPQKASEGIWQGDVALKILGPWDVAYDFQRTSWSDLDWVIARDWEPREKLKSQWPEFADDIDRCQSKSKVMTSGWDLEGNTRYELTGAEDISEEVQVFKLYFRDTPWMPKGRFAMFLETGKMLFESLAGIVYPKLPVEPMFPDNQLDALMGYTPMNDMVGPQEAINSILSAITSNAINYAGQYIIAEEGTGISPKTLEGGHKLITFPAGTQHPPQGLNFTQIPDTLYKHLDNLIQMIQELGGVSNPSRGQATGANMTGAAGLFLASQTAQNQGPITQNFAQFSANVMTQLLHVLRVFGRTERTIEIMGKTVASKTIVMSDALKDFDEVTVDETNPLVDTPQGRLALAQQMMQYGQASPQQVMEVITSGNLNAATDPAREKLYFIQKENQWLNEGKPVQVYATDDHQSHILTHTQLLNLPELRIPELADQTTPQRAQTIMQHIQQHMQIMAGQNQNQAKQNVPGAPSNIGSPALGTAPHPHPIPSPSPAAGVNNPTQAEAVQMHGSLPSMPNQPSPPK